MSKESMRQLNFGVAKETTRGTAEATADYWIPALSLSYNDNVEKFRDESVMGVIPAVTSDDIAKTYASGDVEMYIRDDSIGVFLYNIFGSLSTSANDPESGVHTHSFTESATNNRQAMTVFRKDGVLNEKSANVMIDSFAVSAVVDEYVKATFGMTGKAFADETETPSYSAETRFRPTDISLKIGSAGSSPSSESAITTVESVELTKNGSLDSFYALGDTAPKEINNTEDTIEGTITLSFESETYRDYILDGDNKAIEFKMENTGDTIGSSSNPSLTFTLYEVDFEDWGPDYSTGNIVRETIRFVAHYSLTASKMWDAVLINATSSY